MHDKRELDRRMELAGVRPLKKLGQNFLLNPKICQSIIDEAFADNPQSVIEIGPGLGALTDGILAGKSHVYLIEVDGGLVEFWKGRIKNYDGESEILHRDALKIDWHKLGFPRPSVLVSNLPYSIAASLVVELSSFDQPFDHLVLMFQKEVAERIEAHFSSKDYGMLSVVSQVSWTIKKVIDAGPQDFFPVPHVGSRVLSFKPKHTSFLKSEFLTFVKLAFSQRRKKLSSNLGARYSKEALAEAFKALQLGPDSRAQELTPEQFVSAFQQLQSYK